MLKTKVKGTFNNFNSISIAKANQCLNELRLFEDVELEKIGDTEISESSYATCNQSGENFFIDFELSYDL